ncbi:MAG TPA: aldehyde dehydrogenase [Oscillospiraceae bacterium]|nr:aldehyde dehydrogenase [Oscillospiraceae bacterium]
MDIAELIVAQRAYFDTGATRPVAARRAALLKLRAALLENEGKIAAALRADLNKSPFETYMAETGIVLDEIRFHLRHLEKWAGSRKVRTPLAQFPARSFILPEPRGVALIVAPWNYPLQLCLEPLVGALSAGCCAVVKPSAYAPAASRLVAEILGGAFPPGYVAVVEGGRSENRALFAQKFDAIFFTGSVAVGKEVMAAAAVHLTPVTLELGGKSPVIVDGTADIPLAARRVAFGKLLNAGQTCVAPDYVLVDRRVEEAFLTAYEKAVRAFYPEGFQDFPVIVNEKHFDRVAGLLKSGGVRMGGETDPARRFVAPTLLTGVSPEDPVMREEIFAPVLPVLTYGTLDEAVAFVNAREKPLALYLFTADAAAEKTVLSRCSFGGGCVNDTVVHVASSRLPFGGVGASGMGAYHGKSSFDTFTHYKSIVKKAGRRDLPLRYPPYTERNFRRLKQFLR